MIRTKGEAGTGNVIEAVKHWRAIIQELSHIINCREEELVTVSKKINAPVELLKEIRKKNKMPVVNFAAGGIATPADAALMMQLGCDGVFVGSGIFKSENPQKRAKAIVEAVMYYDNPKKLADISSDLGSPMESQEIENLKNKYAERGW